LEHISQSIEVIAMKLHIMIEDIEKKYSTHEYNYYLLITRFVQIFKFRNKYFCL